MPLQFKDHIGADNLEILFYTLLGVEILYFFVLFFGEVSEWLSRRDAFGKGARLESAYFVLCISLIFLKVCLMALIITVAQ